jgi:ssRNA-specific RNase YbeY (16S rRNA maturation enzyme)
LNLLNVGDYKLDVWFSSERKIIELNKDWRGLRKSTDILSFPACEVINSKFYVLLFINIYIINNIIIIFIV